MKGIVRFDGKGTILLREEADVYDPVVQEGSKVIKYVGRNDGKRSLLKPMLERGGC